MKRKLILVGTILTLGCAALLTGCEQKKKDIPVVNEVDLGKNLIDQAKDAVDNSNQMNPDNLLDSIKDN